MENKEDLDLENIDSMVGEEINLDSLMNEDTLEENADIVSNELLNNSDEYTLGLNEEQLMEFYDYLAGKKPRPLFAERFFADGESRIRESSISIFNFFLSFFLSVLNATS